MSKNTTGIMKKYSLHFKEHKMSGMHSRNLIPSPLEESYLLGSLRRESCEIINALSQVECEETRGE